MGRRREEPLFETMLEVFKRAPWWVGPTVAAAFALFALLLPLLVREEKGAVPVGILLTPLFSMFGWILAIVTLLAWAGAKVWKFFNRRRLDSQTGLRSIRELSWREFENLVCEAYRRRGYVTPHPHPTQRTARRNQISYQ